MRLGKCELLVCCYQPYDTVISSAIQNGANSLAEAFLFTVGASLILAEAWRSNRSQARRRDDVDDQLDDLKTELRELKTQMAAMGTGWEERLEEERSRWAPNTLPRRFNFISL